MFINERYFNSNIYTDRLQNIFDKTLKTDINDSEATILIRELQETLEDLTNASISVYVDDTGVCYTIPVQYSSIPKTKIAADGIKFAKANQYEIMISYHPALIFKNKTGPNLLNSGELTAVTLHEIGHNFVESVIPLGNTLECLKQAILFKTRVNMRGTSIKKDPGFIDILNNIITFLKMYRPDSFYDAFETSKVIIKQTIANLIPFYDPKKYIEEKYADSFAVSYGYGKELASALKKIDTKMARINDNSHNRIISTLGGVYGLMTELIFDEHPSTIARIKAMSDQLEYELEHGKYDKKTKETLKKEIRGINTMLKQYSNMSKRSSYMTAKSAYNELITSLIPNNKTNDILGNLVSELINPEILHKL